jgi:crotonobetainyl-CoA:carnitine CoA-transferase CaiB-like acyl-CoA transferase
MKKQLLEGIRVIDFTWHLTGPLTTKHLSDLGAEVIRVESMRSPDIQRLGGLLGSFNQYNSSKKAITLNLKTPEGLEICKKLIAKCDVLVENFAGGAIERMGLSYDVVSKIKPDIIMCSSCMQGQTGPFAKHPGSGHKLTALCGFNHVYGWPDRGPGWIGAYTDFIAPRYNIIAIMAALEYRRRTGKGQYLDMSQYEGGLQFMSPSILEYVVNGRIQERMGNRSDYAAPNNAYRCKGEERWCAVTVATEEEWADFCKAIGKPELAANPKFANFRARKANETELDEVVTAWTSVRTAEEVMDTLQKVGVAAAVVATGEDLMDKDPQIQYRGSFVKVNHPEYPEKVKKPTYRTQTGNHFQMSKYTPTITPVPKLGEHNEYVYKELCGLSDAEYDKMVEKGVFQ